jgi:hypothetical protein
MNGTARRGVELGEVPMKKLVATLLAALTLAAATPRAARASTETEMAERAVTFVEAMASLVDKDKASCDRMGTDLDAYIKGHASEIAGLKAWGDSLSQEQKRALMEKYKARIEAAATKLAPALTTCRDNPKVREAHEELRHAAGG